MPVMPANDRELRGAKAKHGMQTAPRDIEGAAGHTLGEMTERETIIEFEHVIKEKETRLKAQEKNIRIETDELERAKLDFERQRKATLRELAEKENELARRENAVGKKWSDSSDFLGEHSHQTMNIPLGQPFPPTQDDTITPRNNTAPPVDFPRDTLPKVSFRDATESVPTFDGYTVSLAQFTRACRRAREIVPPSSERNLTRLLINKLRGRAYYAVEDEPCDTVTELIDLLVSAFGSPKTLSQYRGEMSTIFMKTHEHVLDYISRVKDLRTNILDEERRTRGNADRQFITETDELTIKSFYDGLPLEYRLQIGPESRRRLTDVFTSAKTISKIQELDRQRHEPRYREERGSNFYRHNINSIGRPQAHSTPYRNSGSSPRYRDERNPPRYNDERNSRNSPTLRRDYANYRDPRPHENRANNNPNHSNPQNSRREPRPDAKHCRYCKNAGHEISECRKRQYNNGQRNDQGNLRSPTGRLDATRSEEMPKVRPINSIETIEINESESQ